MALYSYRKQKSKLVVRNSKRFVFVPAILFITGISLLGYIGYPYLSFYAAQYFKVDNLSKELISPPGNFTAYADTQSNYNKNYTDNVLNNIAQTSQEIKNNNYTFEDLTKETGSMTLNIDQIGLKNVPITINTNTDSEVQYDAVLNHSIAHFKGTSLPGHSGKTFLFGHSSRTLPGGSAFSSIFTNIDKLNLADEFSIEYKGKIFKYTVYKIKLIDRDDFSVIKGDQRKTLSLMTCKPDGIGSKRLIVEALEEGDSTGS